MEFYYLNYRTTQSRVVIYYKYTGKKVGLLSFVHSFIVSCFLTLSRSVDDDYSNGCSKKTKKTTVVTRHQKVSSEFEYD